MPTFLRQLPDGTRFVLCRTALQSQDREDAERLNWLDMAAHCADWLDNEPTKRVIRAHDGAEFTGDTWREAIDHARLACGGDHE